MEFMCRIDPAPYKRGSDSFRHIALANLYFHLYVSWAQIFHGKQNHTSRTPCGSNEMNCVLTFQQSVQLVFTSSPYIYNGPRNLILSPCSSFSTGQSCSPLH